MPSKATKGLYTIRKQDVNGLPKDAVDLIVKLTKVDEDERLSVGDALDHPWFTSSINMLEFLYSKLCIC